MIDKITTLQCTVNIFVNKVKLTVIQRSSSCGVENTTDFGAVGRDCLYYHHAVQVREYYSTV